MNGHPHPTIKTLDNPPRVLFWSIDEFLFMAIPMFLGIALGCIYLVPGGLLLKWGYAKVKKKMPFGSFKHRIYWLMPTSCLRRTIRTLPPSHNREYLL